MGGCSAPNCTSNSRKGDRLFRFPRDRERRKRWVINCRRVCWVPTLSSLLCEHHFEESQFENNRKDNLKKLVPFAIPTLFDVPNPPEKIADSQRQLLKRQHNDECDIFDSFVDSDHSYAKQSKVMEEAVPTEVVPAEAEPSILNVELIDPSCNQCQILKLENRRLKYQVKALQESLNNIQKSMSNFLGKDQLQSLTYRSNHSNKWSDDTIKTALQIRYACGTRGYEFLRKLSVPLPAYRTLCHRVSNAPTTSNNEEDDVPHLINFIENNEEHEGIISSNAILDESCQ